MATNLDRRAPSEALVTEDSRKAFSDQQIALIAQTVAKGASPAELHFFLNLASRYNLDPFQGEVWCVKTRGKNGGEGRIAIIVGEQGRLKIANRYPDYRGFRSDTVCANDTFRKLSKPVKMPGVEGYTYIEHSYGHPNERGEIVGAWCEVYRDGRPPTYFYAPLREYAPDRASASEAALLHIPWFSTESRMIEKCSISTAFRMAFNLAGIYGEEEMDHVRKQEDAAGSVEDEIDWGTDASTMERLKSLFAAANNCKPGSYPPAKIRLMLAGLDDAGRGEVCAEVVRFIRANGGTVPEPGEIVVDEADMVFEEPVAEPEPDGAHVEAEAAGEEPLPGV